MPEYETKLDGNQPLLVPIEDMTQEECPISIMGRNPAMSLLASEVISLQTMKEFSGAVPFGPDTNKWPARWFDVVRLAHGEKSRASEEIEKARERMRHA